MIARWPLIFVPLALYPIISGWLYTAQHGIYNFRHGEADLGFHHAVVLPGLGLGALCIILGLAFERRWLFTAAIACLVVAIIPDQYMIWKFVLVQHLHVTPSHHATHAANALLVLGGIALALGKRKEVCR